MAELITRCPSCLTDFRIARAQLNMADGIVRCGACLNTFDALTGSEKNRTDNPVQQPEPNQQEFEYDTQSKNESVETVDNDISIPELMNFDVPENIDLDDLILQSSISKTKASATQKVLLTSLLIIGSLQLIYFHSDKIYQHPTYGKWVSQFCQQLGCPMPKQINWGAIHSRQLQVYSSKRVANALVVDAVVENRAAFAQPFPPLLLQFENLQGEVIYKRVFRSRHYLQGNLAGSTTFPAKGLIHIQLEIVDPGPSATNYALLVAK